MSIVAVADTHAALWHLFDDPRLSAAADAVILNATAIGLNVGVSSISLAEIVYLEEKRRIRAGAFDELVGALRDPDHIFIEVAFTAATAEAMRRVSRTEVPDMPDRMIAATAVQLGIPVISRDRRIRVSSVETVW